MKDVFRDSPYLQEMPRDRALVRLADFSQDHPSVATLAYLFAHFTKDPNSQSPTIFSGEMPLSNPIRRGLFSGHIAPITEYVAPISPDTTNGSLRLLLGVEPLILSEDWVAKRAVLEVRAGTPLPQSMEYGWYPRWDYYPTLEGRDVSHGTEANASCDIRGTNFPANFTTGTSRFGNGLRRVAEMKANTFVFRIAATSQAIGAELLRLKLQPEGLIALLQGQSKIVYA